MKKYIKLDNNGVPQSYSFGQLRLDNPDVSFPKNPSDTLLESFGVFELTEGDKPNEDVVTKGPIELVNGKWTQTYTGRPQTLSERRSQMKCTPRQARLALAQTGKYGNVKAIINQLPADQKETVEIEWEYATEFERNSPTLQALTSTLGMTEEEIDQLFELAATL